MDAAATLWYLHLKSVTVHSDRGRTNAEDSTATTLLAFDSSDERSLDKLDVIEAKAEVSVTVAVRLAAAAILVLDVFALATYPTK